MYLEYILSTTVLLPRESVVVSCFFSRYRPAARICTRVRFGGVACVYKRDVCVCVSVRASLSLGQLAR